jgi:hypothetical protein
LHHSIQEVVYAKAIKVHCGTKSFPWGSFQTLCANISMLDESNWLAHYPHAFGVFQSSTAVLVWERALWRHTETSAPSLQTLVHTFHHCNRTDPRDKVFALLGMARDDTSMQPDYSLLACQLYHAMQSEAPFDDVLAQVLGVSAQDRFTNDAW